MIDAKWFISKDNLKLWCSVGGVNYYFMKRPPHKKLGVGIPMTYSL